VIIRRESPRKPPEPPPEPPEIAASIEIGQRNIDEATAAHARALAILDGLQAADRADQEEIAKLGAEVDRLERERDAALLAGNEAKAERFDGEVRRLRLKVGALERRCTDRRPQIEDARREAEAADERKGKAVAALERLQAKLAKDALGPRSLELIAETEKLFDQLRVTFTKAQLAVAQSGVAQNTETLRRLAEKIGFAAQRAGQQTLRISVGGPNIWPLQVMTAATPAELNEWLNPLLPRPHIEIVDWRRR